MRDRIASRRLESPAGATADHLPAGATRRGRREATFEILEKYLTRRFEYSAAARKTGERGPRKVPAAFDAVKSPEPRGRREATFWGTRAYSSVG